MAHISEFRTGDSITFTHKGATFHAVIEKINRKSVKALQVGDQSWSVQAAFGRPARMRSSIDGSRWNMPVSDSGNVSFSHETGSPKLGRCAVRLKMELRAALIACVEAGVSNEDVLELVRKFQAE